MTIELTLTVTQMVNNWKEMNELTVTVTQKIWITVPNCNSKVFVTTVTVTQKKSATQKTLAATYSIYISLLENNRHAAIVYKTT